MLEAFNDFNIYQISCQICYINMILIISYCYSFKYFIEYCNYFKNFKYLIISHCSIVLDILLNIVITLKSQNLESNKVIIIIKIVFTL